MLFSENSLPRLTTSVQRMPWGSLALGGKHAPPLDSQCELQLGTWLGRLRPPSQLGMAVVGLQQDASGKEVGNFQGSKALTMANKLLDQHFQ